MSNVFVNKEASAGENDDDGGGDVAIGTATWNETGLANDLATTLSRLFEVPRQIRVASVAPPWKESSPFSHRLARTNVF